MVLAGDVGGTNARLALFRERGGSLEMEDLEIFPAREYAGLEDALDSFLKKRGSPRVVSACIGIAGIIHDGVVEMVNLHWRVEIAKLARALKLDSLVFINDLEANARGIEALGPEDFAVLNAGEEDPEGNRGLVSAGTGLGEGGLIRAAGEYLTFHSEGGHVAFGPRDEEEIALLRYMLARSPYVSYEHILSGPGLMNIYGFLRDTGRGEEPAWLTERMRQGIGSQVITEGALAGESALCGKALDMFVSIYGNVAGNMGLKMMATGGVYLGGGIAPKILPRLRDKSFLEAFWSRGPVLGPILARMPVKVILNDKAALLGAARLATSLDKRIATQP